VPTRAAIGLLAAVLLVVPVARAQSGPYPIFDAHIHYSRPDWDAITPELALSILARAGIRRAIVSSTPDDGTLMLWERAPQAIVPFLRPYRTRDDMGSWTRDPEVAAYVEERLQRGIYKGLGELHFGPSDVDAPVVKRLAELAAERGIFLHCHIDYVTARMMLERYPETKVLWAHAGTTAGAKAVHRLLNAYPMLWVELAGRTDVAPGGLLDPAWRSVFMKHPDRFMVGTDTWRTSRWSIVRDSMRVVQVWLRQLPREVAEQLAYKNGDRLFPEP